MSQAVLTLPYETIQEMNRYYKEYLKRNSPAGTVFAAKIDGCTITAYQSGKVLFQGNNCQKEALKWGDYDAFKEETSPSLPSWIEGNHIGTDEAGTGDYFGPVTVAGVYIQKDQIQLLKDLGVKDSKNLSDQTVQELARKIVQLDIPYSLMTLENEKYNELQKRGWSQGKMKALLHYHVIEKLTSKLHMDNPLEGIIIDQFAEKDVFKRHLYSENLEMPDHLFFLKKAERYSLAVAAASIIARYKFLSALKHLSAKLGIELPKGAGHQVDETAARLIRIKGRETLNSCAKIHFANTDKATRLL
ncbi:ribonuclease HIII [Melghiribacillus thermohalophilus]|uniref:Ribonuclease HIII n=1 Tax=Melghiribacillus thermohalophilus TaxID=1324956 RepID=A0A4R3NCX6_9BACI|nr:ribonuclease HIII [Melghiribacillus thermohalophilus]TCT25043.1 ribonuclease HIII [Melghiribacillus thermohalophilus]